MLCLCRKLVSSSNMVTINHHITALQSAATCNHSRLTKYIAQTPHQLQHVLVVQAAVDTNLALHLVVVQLRQLASVVHLDCHLCACCFADGQVHCRSITTTQLFGNNKLIDAPARQTHSESVATNAGRLQLLRTADHVQLLNGQLQAVW